MNRSRVSDLKVFQRAYEQSLEIHKSSLTFPQMEQFALADQIRRASKSICVNLAEGYAKRVASQVDFKRYLVIALGSSDEMQIWSRYCSDLGYLDATAADRWIREYESISGMLQALIRKVAQGVADS